MAWGYVNQTQSVMVICCALSGSSAPSTRSLTLQAEEQAKRAEADKLAALTALQVCGAVCCGWVLVRHAMCAVCLRARPLTRTCLAHRRNAVASSCVKRRRSARWSSKSRLAVGSGQ